MSDEEATYPNSVISKATKLVILTTGGRPGVPKEISNRLYVCDSHYDQLVESGVDIEHHSSLLDEFGFEKCDMCLKERENDRPTGTGK